MAAMGTGQQIAAEWRRLAQRIGDMGEHIMALAGDEPQDQGEGIRYLTRFLRYAFMLQLESADPDFPRLFRPSSETLKFIGDSPDYYYQMAAIGEGRSYRIQGSRGAAPRLHFSTYALGPAGISCSGSLATPDIALAEDGTFEIIASPTPAAGNWLPVEPGALFLQVRNFFSSHHREDPAEVKIEAIGGPPWPKPYVGATALSAIGKAIAQLERTVPLTVGFFDQVLERVGPNCFDEDQGIWQSMGGNTATWYVQGVYDLAPGEGLVVETDWPECSYFSFQLNNRWFESLDYIHRQIYWSSYTSRPDPDGLVRYLVAAENRGFAHWLDTSGHCRGLMHWKWNDVARPPQITVRKVILEELDQ